MAAVRKASGYGKMLGSGYSGRSKQRPYGMLLRQHVWVKKARASSRTPQNCG